MTEAISETCPIRNTGRLAKTINPEILIVSSVKDFIWNSNNSNKYMLKINNTDF